METLEYRVMRSIQTRGLLVPGDKVLVGVSGGADSVCLLRVLNALRERLGIVLHAAHVNHGLRGAEAEADEAFVQTLCDELAIPLSVHRADVGSLAKERGCGVEEMGREVRYAFFRRLVQERGMTKIAVAHNADDNVETILMAHLRGTGLAGLSGMAWEREGIIRPLLDVSRAEIEAYMRGRAYRTDRTNGDTTYFRNRVRLELLPYLKKQCNPNYAACVLERAPYYAEVDDFLETAVDAAYAAAGMEDGLSMRACAALHPAVRRGVVRRFLGCRGADASFRHVDAVLGLMEKGQTGRSLDVGGGLVVRLSYDLLQIVHTKEDISYCYTLPVGGSVYVPETGYMVYADVVDDMKPGSADAYVDGGKLAGGELCVRSRRPGDWFLPFGMGHRKKLKDFLMDRKVPQDVRDRIPIVTCGSDVVWVGGMRLDERYQVTERTTQVVRLRLAGGGPKEGEG